MRPIQKTLSFQAADVDSVATAQTPADGVDLTIDGALASGGVATFYEPTVVDLISSDDLSTVTFTVIGTAANGRVISEDVTGPNNETVSTVQLFQTVTAIEVDTLTTFTTETLTVGNPDSASFSEGETPTVTTAWLPLDIYNPTQVTTISCNELAGAVTYSVEFTNEDPFDTSITQLAAAHPAVALTNATSSQTASTEVLMRAVRVVATGSGSLRVTVVQQSTV
jgi:hypothetical protein